MNRITKSRKYLKYGVLRKLPGEAGRHYDGKFNRLTQVIRFEKAIHNSQGKTNIDLGANLGVFTKMLSSGAKQVIAFEPDPWTFEVLRINVSELNNVKLENVAAGVSEEPVFLFRHREFEENPSSRSKSSSIVSDAEYLNREEGIEVNQVDFIRYIENLREDIGVLKIDIEGAEVDLLESLFDRPDLLNRIDYIFAETHEKWIPTHAMRVKVLREKASRLKRPIIDLDWA